MQSRQFIPALEGLRGCAAFVIFVYYFHHIAAFAPLIDLFPLFFAKGWVAVDIFFVISGWVMGHVYFRDLSSRHMSRISSFILARIARLVPLHFAAVLIYLGLSPYLKTLDLDLVTLGDVLHQLTLTFTWGPFLAAKPFIPPTWSISAEFVAYLLFPFIVFLGFPSTACRGIMLIMIGIFGYSSLQVTLGSIHIMDEISPLRAISGFLIGLGIWRLGTAWEISIGRHVHYWEIAAIAIFALAIPFSGEPLMLLLSASILITAITNNRSYLAVFLGGKVPQFLGKISYSLYIFHWFAIVYLARVVESISSIQIIIVILATVTVVLCCSSLITRYFERPMTRILRHMFGLQHRTRPTIEVERS